MKKLEHIKKIIIHCSASEFGDARIIKKWHLERGWSDIGYHFVILNGFRNNKAIYNEEWDGKVERGRGIEYQGAHCYGHNNTSIGICLIGEHLFSVAQLKSLYDQVYTLVLIHKLGANDVYGHNEFSSNKTCPNFNVGVLRNLLNRVL